MNISTRIQAGICGALISLSTAGAANAQNLSTTDHRRFVSIGYAAGALCQVMKGNLNRDTAIGMVAGEMNEADADFMQDVRVVSYVRKLGRYMHHNTNDCMPQSVNQKRLAGLHEKDMFQLYGVSQNY